MTERQKKLYDYMVLHAVKDWVCQEDIINALEDEYPEIIPMQPFHDSAARLAMTRDIRAINDDDSTSRIIISSAKGVKIANKEEFAMYIGGELEAVSRKYDRIQKKIQKANLDGQFKLDDEGHFITIKVFEKEKKND